MIHDIHSRLVEVSRTTAGRGTGYAVAADLVLTAAHLVAHDDAVRVVTRDRQLAGNVVWRHPTLDAALVRVPGRPWQGIDTRWGKLSGVGSVTCTAVGYPRAQRTADGASVEEQLGGSIMPLTARSIDRYAINVTTALPRESRTSTSPWSGMSGAAVLSADGQHLLGLIIEYPNQFEPARLEAVPVAGLLADADFVELIRADPSALIALTDVSAGDAHPVASSRGLAQPWRARIESLDDGRVLGLGFLIDAAHVLTHAVAGHTRVRVVFPGVRTEATVIFRGADVVVARLSERVSIAPAEMASPTALRDRRLDPVLGELFVHGLPRLCVPSDVADGAGRVRLEPLGAPTTSLLGGFGGAAVSLADTGAVVGMIAETGTMLPLNAIRSCWPPFTDLLPLGDLPAPAARELRRLFENIHLDASPTAIYQSSLPTGIGPVPPPLPTLWDAARFVSEELIAPSGEPVNTPLTRFCHAVLRRIDGRWRRRQLRGWIREHLGVDEDPSAGPGNEPDTGLVTVRVTPSAEGQHYSVTVSSHTGDEGQLLFSGRRRAEAIRSTVEGILPAALERIPEHVVPENVLVQFELPLSWLGKPVDEWHAGPRDSGVPIGWTYPVVVRDLGTARVAVDRSRLVRRRWQILRGQTKPELHAVDCRDRRDRRTITAWLAGEVRGILTLAAAPRNPESDRAVRAGLSVGLPVMLWPRTRCTDDHGDGGSCAGDRFLDVLRHALESTAPPDLPERVRDLRVAAHAARNDLARCRAVTLFWHDPDMTPREPHSLVLGSATRDDA